MTEERAIHEQALAGGWILESIHDAAFSVDLDGRLQLWSSRAEVLYGRSAAEVRGQKVSLLFHSEELSRLTEQILPKMLRRGSQQVLMRQLGASGDEILVDLLLHRLNGPGGEGVGWLGCARELSVLPAAEAATREYRERMLQLSAELVSLQEVERRRLARELHDDLGQRMTALTFGVGALRQGPGMGDVLRQRIDRLHRLAKKLMRDLRNLSHDAHSSSFRHLNPTEFMDRCAELSRRMGLKVEISSKSLKAHWPPAVALGLFRIVQESLSNVRRHSGSRSAAISVEHLGNDLQLVVEDTGQGFDPASSSEGLGLTSMSERARLLGGELRVDSQPGLGTRVVVRLPFRRP